QIGEAKAPLTVGGGLSDDVRLRLASRDRCTRDHGVLRIDNPAAEAGVVHGLLRRGRSNHQETTKDRRRRAQQMAATHQEIHSKLPFSGARGVEWFLHAWCTHANTEGAMMPATCGVQFIRSFLRD